jgi:hypothetical protein
MCYFCNCFQGRSTLHHQSKVEDGNFPTRTNSGLVQLHNFKDPDMRDIEGDREKVPVKPISLSDRVLVYSPLPLSPRKLCQQTICTHFTHLTYSPYLLTLPLESVRNKPSNKDLGLSCFTLFLVCLTSVFQYWKTPLVPRDIKLLLSPGDFVLLQPFFLQG